MRIEVRTRAIADDRIEIEIADNGRGIAERDQARVFDLFKRSGTQDRPGDGIGLAYVACRFAQPRRQHQPDDPNLAAAPAFA